MLKVFRKLGDVLVPGRKVDSELLEELEEALIEADVKAETAMGLIEELEAAARSERVKDAEGVREVLKKRVAETLDNDMDRALAHNPDPPTVILVVGVNGTGKTTTIGKLAHYYQRHGHKVLLAAADTFRAAAIEQLTIWAERAGAEIVAHKEGADPAAVVYDALTAAKARGYHEVIVDTAGRLHTKGNLMKELEKIHRVCEKALGRPADEVLLIVDATTGQNAVRQAQAFAESVDLTGIVLTKLDGTARGGAVLGIQSEFGIPVKLIGVGEKIEDLLAFDPAWFSDNLF
ncbi:MAG: signal recognition particle-docking protein FtsY [Armatimonadia bacterium]|nr:signal recognition particle-docking protein FtsY [Armatimonadia bacterium]